MAEEDDLCECEREKQSPHSPGIVSNDESLAKTVYYPGHVDDDDRITPDAFSLEDLKTRGVSVDRLAHVDFAVMAEGGKQRAERQDAEPRGYCEVLTADLRQIRDQETDQRTLCVRDTALETDPAHADFIRSADQNRTVLRALRGDLPDLFSVAKTIET